MGSVGNLIISVPTIINIILLVKTDIYSLIGFLRTYLLKTLSCRVAESTLKRKHGS